MDNRHTSRGRHRPIRRAALARFRFILAVGLWPVSIAGAGVTYHLHKEATGGIDASQLKKTGPDSAKFIYQTKQLRKKPAGEYPLRGFATAPLAQVDSGFLPAGSGIEATLWMNKTAARGQAFARFEARLNGASGPLLCEGTAASPVTTKWTKHRPSCATQAAFALNPGDRLFLQVLAYLQTGPGRGNLKVQLGVEGKLNGQYDSQVTFPEPGGPQLLSASPDVSPPRAVVELLGSNLGSTGVVTFGGEVAPIKSWSSDRVVVRVPLGATSGPVILAVAGRESNPLPFTILEVVYRPGFDFGPFRDGRNPDQGDQVTESEVESLMEELAPYTDDVRCFGMAGGLAACGRIARGLGLRAACSAWLSDDAEANERELASLIGVLQDGDCELAVVGSEVLLRGDMPVDELIGYIERVRAAAPGVPVTTAEIHGILRLNPSILAAVDVVMGNFHPYWEEQPIEVAMASLDESYERLRAAAGGKEVIVSESGWPSCGNAQGQAEPTPENAAFYFLNFTSWARAKGVRFYYFEAWNEPFKAEKEGPQGACWGVWDEAGNLKPGMQDVFDGLTVPDNWSCRLVGGGGVPSISFTYVPPRGSFDELEGQVTNVVPCDYKVAVYIFVGGGWWTKPTFAAPGTSIERDGSWTCDITTGGNDQDATAIAAYLVPNDYDIPLASGEPTLPPGLMENAVAQVEAMR